MRRLLPAIVTVGLLLGFAAAAMATSRVPKGITKVNVTLTIPASGSTTRGTQHKTITKAASVAAIVSATDGLQPPSTKHIMCPMIMRLGPALTVIFRNAKGVEVAEATAQVTLGSKGDDGTSPCFPIRLVMGGKSSALLGNGWIRMMGRMIGTAIS